MKIKLTTDALILKDKVSHKKVTTTVPLSQLQGYGFEKEKAFLIVSENRLINGQKDGFNKTFISHNDFHKILKLLRKYKFNWGNTDTYWVDNKYLIIRV